MTTFWLRLWWWSRGRAIASLQARFPAEYRDAHRAWAHGARALGPPAWNTDGLPNDLALHDAADRLLGRQA